jgi:hypothetical protein
MYTSSDGAVEDLRAAGFGEVQKIPYPYDLDSESLGNVPQEAIGWEMIVARNG